MPTPSLTVVIPAFNEEELLPRALKALKAQSDTNFTTIVVDNNCTDRTAEIAESFGATVVKESTPGAGFARQAGFAAAKTEFIATTDADSIVPKNWVKTTLKTFLSDPTIVAIGGPVSYDIHDRVMNAVVNKSIPYLHQIDRLVHANQHHLIGANCAVRRTVFTKIGGFKTELSLGEDLDLSHRLAEVGHIKFLPELRVRTSDRRFHQMGPTVLLKYFQNYLEVTRPSDSVRKQIETMIEHVREQLNDRS